MEAGAVKGLHLNNFWAAVITESNFWLFLATFWEIVGNFLENLKETLQTLALP